MNNQNKTTKNTKTKKEEVTKMNKNNQNKIENADINLTASTEVDEQSSAIATNSVIPVSEIRIKKPGFFIKRGEGYNLEAEVLPANATNKTLRWSSDNQMGLMIMDNDYVIALSGSGKITARATDGSGVTAERSMAVVDIVLAKSIDVRPSEHYLVQKDVYMMRATVQPEKITCSCIRWYSDDPTIATVNPQSGLVMGQNPGTTYIHAKATDGSEVEGTCMVHILSRQKICLPGGRRYNWNQHYNEIETGIGPKGCAWTCGLDVANLYGSKAYYPSDMLGDNRGTYWNDERGYRWKVPDNCVTFGAYIYAKDHTQAQLYSVIRHEINNNKPIIIGTSGSRSDHFVVAYGYTGAGASPEEILVFDPAGCEDATDPATGRTVTLAQAMSYSSQNTTIVRLKPILTDREPLVD